MDNKKDKKEAWMKAAKQQQQKASNLTDKNKNLTKQMPKEQEKQGNIYKKDAWMKSSKEQQQKSAFSDKNKSLTKDLTKNMKDTSFKSSREQQQKMSRFRREEDRDTEDRS